MSDIYWITRLVHLGQFLEIAALLLVFFGFAGMGAMAMDAYTPSDIPHKQFKACVISVLIGVALFVVNIFIPNQQELALMYGWKVLSTDAAQEVIELIKERCFR